MFFKRCENKCFNQHHLIWRTIQKQQAIRISTITASTQQSTGLDCAISDDSIQTNNICKNNTLDVMHQRNRRRIFRCAMYLFWGISIYIWRIRSHHRFVCCRSCIDIYTPKQRNIWWPSESEIRLKDQWTILNQMCDQYGKVNLGTVDLNEIVIGSAVTSSLQMHSLYSFVEYFSFNPLRGGEGVVQGSWMGNNLHCTRSIRQLSNLAALLKNSEKL